MNIIQQNRIGLDVEYTSELERDIMCVHNIHMYTLVMMMYGTTFKVNKEFKNGFNWFTLKTNDERDAILTWQQKELQREKD